MIKRFLAVVAATMAVLGAGAGSALADYPPAMQAGAVSATTVVAGGQVNFAGDGFADGSDVTVEVNKALYATVVAAAAVTTNPAALGSRTSLHFTNAAFVRPAALVARQGDTASFAVKVTLNTPGANVLTGAGIAPDGTPHVVTATVTVAGDAEAVKPTASGLPFTGSEVIIPGVIIGAAMLAGGLLMLTTVRSRKAGART